MLDFSHIPTQYPNADVQVFTGQFTPDFAVQDHGLIWMKPRGKTMGHILLIGAGGDGGNGVVGANSLAGGGGGGSSSSQLILKFPLWAVPDRLFINLNNYSNYINTISFSQIVANGATPAVIDTFAVVQTGRRGGNGTAVPAGGAGGTSGGVPALSLMPQGASWVVSAIAGQAGTAGGGAGASGASLTRPVTGLLVTGGTGGGGLSSAGSQGFWGGDISAGGMLPIVNAGAPSAADTVPPGDGVSGPVQSVPGLCLFSGGTGGASGRGSATGAGLVQASGGMGAYGCGGGGSGAALTGSTPGTPGKGGPAICIITCW